MCGLAVELSRLPVRKCIVSVAKAVVRKGDGQREKMLKEDMKRTVL